MPSGRLAHKSTTEADLQGRGGRGGGKPFEIDVKAQNNWFNKSAF